MSPVPTDAPDDNVVKHILESIVTRVNNLRLNKATVSVDAHRNAFSQPVAAAQTAVVPPSAFAIALPSEEEQVTSDIRATGRTFVHNFSTSNNLIITDTLAAFVVRAIILNPENSFPLDTIFTKIDVDRLIETSSSFISHDGHPESETVKMQVYFDSTFPQQGDYLHREKQAQKNTTTSLFREIAEYNSTIRSHRQGTAVVNPKAFEALYSKIVGYILLNLAMGNPTDPQVIREVYVALESIFPQSEALTFMNLTRSDKEKQLNGLSQLVAGIRLFNRHVNKSCKDKIENVPELCSNEIKEAFDILKALSTNVECKIRQLSALLSIQFMDTVPSLASISGEINKYLSQCQTFYRQILIYLDTIRDQIESSSRALKALEDRMSNSLTELAQSCRAKSAVPVDQVYPKFMELAVIWQAFQDELFLDAFRRGVLDTLVAFEKCVSSSGLRYYLPTTNWESIQSSLDLGDMEGLESELIALLSAAPESVQIHADNIPTEPLQSTDEQIINAATLLEIDLNHLLKSRRNSEIHQHSRGSIEVLHPGNTTQYYKLPVEFGGFCPVTLCTGQRQGIVVPGNWNFGIIKYLDKLYAFDGPDKVKRFASGPDLYVEREYPILLDPLAGVTETYKQYYRILLKVLEIARQRMGLVQLLQLYGYFPSIRALENAEILTQQALLGQRPLVCEVGSQVDTHLVDQWIDPKYEWNEWVMRRRALMLVNIRNKATHGSQTQQSHFRREQDVQAFPNRQGGVQTYRDAATGDANFRHT